MTRKCVGPRSRLGARPLAFIAVLAGIGGCEAAEDATTSGRFLAGAPLSGLSATRDRPLFTPSRRVPRAAPPAPPAPVQVKPAVAEETPRLTLLGIIRLPDGNGSTVLMDETVRTSYTLKVGDDRRGWIVRAIDAGGVTIAKGGQTVRLAFLKGAK